MKLSKLFILFIPFMFFGCAELDGRITRDECVALVNAVDARISSGDKIFADIKSKCDRYAD